MRIGEEFVLIGIHYMLKVANNDGRKVQVVMSLQLCQHDRDNKLKWD